MRRGGTEQHLLHVLPALCARGFDVTAVLLDRGGALEEQLRRSPVKVITPRFSLPRPWRTLVQAMTLRRVAAKTGARIVHAYLSEPYLAAAAARCIPALKSPVLVYGRRSLAFYTGSHPLAQRAERWAHRMASTLVGNSSAVAAELVAESGGPAKVAIIHNGIPLAGPVLEPERMAAREKFGIAADELVLTLVANFHRYKGHLDLVEALGLAVDRMPPRWRLVLAGRDAGCRERLEARIGDLNLAANVLFIGEWPGSREPYAAADIGLLVSHTEGFSNSLIEGMAAGCAMIATSVGGNSDAIDHGRTGLLVPPKAPAELAGAILELAHDPQLRHRLARAARTEACDRFSLETCVDRYEALWRSLAAPKPTR